MYKKLFLDSVDMKEISRFSWLIDGVTTTPTFFKKENIDYDKFIKEYRQKYPEKELHIEALSNTVDKTEGEIQRIINEDWFDKEKVILKIPISEDNLRLVKHYSEENIKFNTHLVFTPNQASLASIVGSQYICPLMGRYADSISEQFGKNLHGGDQDYSAQLLSDCREIVDQNTNNKSLIMGSSVRSTGDYYNALRFGADVVTVKPSILAELFDNNMTTEGINTFLEDMDLI